MTPRSSRPSNTARLIGFVMLPLLSMLVAIFVIPVIVSVGGSDGWAAIAIGQAVGTLASYLVAFGWGVVGPHQVALASEAEQSYLYRVSFRVKLILATVVVPASCTVSYLLVSDHHKSVAVLVSFAFALQGFAPSWFLIGQGRPFMIALLETGPRVAAQLIASVAAVVTSQLLAYVVIIAFIELAIGVVARITLVHTSTARVRSKDVLGSLREQWPLALAAIVGAGYARAAVPIVAVVSYAAAAPFGALDRFQGIARSGLRPFVSFFQSWITRPGRVWGVPRQVLATWCVVSLGVAAGLLLGVGLPVADEWLFVGEFEITQISALWLGTAIVAIAGSYCTSLFYLVPQRRTGAISWSTGAGSLLAIPMIFVLVPRLGQEGAIMSVAVAEILVLGLQVIAIKSRRRRSSQVEST